jgi:hypothetical protein
MKFTKLLAAATVLILSTALSGLACDCLTRNASESFADATAVFVGTVTKDEVDFHRSVYTLRVEQSFKGNVPSEVKLTHESMCGRQFHLGWQYIVYAQQFQGRYFASSCLATRPLAEPREDPAVTREIPASDIAYERARWWRKIGGELFITGYLVIVFVTGGLFLDKVRKRPE